MAPVVSAQVVCWLGRPQYADVADGQGGADEMGRTVVDDENAELRDDGDMVLEA